MSVPCGYFSSNVSTRPLFLLLFCLVLFLAFIQAAFRPLHASDTEEQTELLLSAPILQAVRSHPQILSQNAKLCQSIYRLGLSRAEQRAQISAKLSGGKRLGSNFNSKSSDADRASLRGFKDSENKVFDLDVTLRYALWDWDRGDNRVASYELTYAVNQLELENVTFTYDDQPEATLHDINLTIEEGERVAILGRIGCGKTTLLRLVCGLYPTDSGIVMIDNADIRQIRASDVRRNIGTVLQNPVLFSGTIRDNLIMGNPDARDEDLLEAARLSGANSFIGMFPGGFDFPLSERGQELSAGMRQTLAIACALIGKPNILIMDEPTAAMDSGTEQKLVEKLDLASRGLTSIFVTHRGAMLQLADKMVVMERGHIVLAGPRDEVLARLQAQAEANKQQASEEVS